MGIEPVPFGATRSEVQKRNHSELLLLLLLNQLSTTPLLDSLQLLHLASALQRYRCSSSSSGLCKGQETPIRHVPGPFIARAYYPRSASKFAIEQRLLGQELAFQA